jgi:flagellar basal-body rod protein FlgB
LKEIEGEAPMYGNLDVIQRATDMARHSAARQAVVAQNLANADTPGYRALAMPSYEMALRQRPGLALSGTRPGHLGTVAALSDSRARDRMTEPAPNGNAVSLEAEMLQGVEAQREHSRALSIWRHAIGVLRTSLGR